MKTRQQLSSVFISLLVHAAVLIAMAMITLAVEERHDSFVIETMLADETRVREEFSQDLDIQEEIADSLNFIAGGIVSTAVGGSDAPIAKQTKIDHDEMIKDPDVTVKVGVRNLPGLDILGDDLGEAEVTGEIGAVVNGYGAALDRLTKELIRLMRDHRLLVVWLFDESESMKDDQKEIKSRIYRVYEELKLIERDPETLGTTKNKKSKLQEILLTGITSFGGSYHVQLPEPTGDIRAVLPAIDRIPVDKTGKENMCLALATAIRQFGASAVHGRRKLVLIVVSDESGDDSQHVEEVLHEAKRLRAPIYVLGREAVFGSLYAHVRWIQPQTGRLFYLPIRRGPETPFAEQMQYDGFRRRRDSHMSGFGPYEQVRLARDTGGIFFQLPHEQADLNDLDNREFEMLDLKEYVPNLDSRRDYAKARDNSDFRRAIWDVIVMLNPYNENNKGLELPEYEYFTFNPNSYASRVAKRIKQIMSIVAIMGAAQKRLESVRRLRAKEPARRWRANYDLIVAQLFAYRVRLFEYAIGLDQFAKNLPKRKLKNPKSNRWSIGQGAAKLVMPDTQQVKLLSVTPQQLKEAHQQALLNLATVIERHPRTAWSRRAEWELRRKFGVRFAEHYFRPPKKMPKSHPPPPPKL